MSVSYTVIAVVDRVTHHFCREDSADSTRILPRVWKYGMGTGPTVLRRHIEKNHEDAYLQVCQAKNWKSYLPGRAEVAQVAASRPPYTYKAFLEHLVGFIVKTDQVFRLKSPSYWDSSII